MTRELATYDPEATELTEDEYDFYHSPGSGITPITLPSDDEGPAEQRSVEGKEPLANVSGK